MIGVTTTKEGVLFQKIAPSGFRILSAIDQTAWNLGIDLEITAGTNGTHSGPNDPHYRGEAYDLHSKSYTPDLKQQIFEAIMSLLGFDRFYGFLEDEGTPNEHWHFQRKKGTAYP